MEPRWLLQDDIVRQSDGNMVCSNLPALNELLSRFGIRFSNQVYSGQFTFHDNIIEVR